MRLAELTRRVPGARLLPAGGAEGPAAEVGSVVYRADRAGPGALFCCLRGVRADGHDFAPEAVARGAAALVVERPLELPVPQLLTGDARLAMALTAAALAGDPSHHLEVVGVTGTNGKTTSAYLV